jgi:hypothetical protein
VPDGEDPPQGGTGPEARRPRLREPIADSLALPNRKRQIFPTFQLMG